MNNNTFKIKRPTVLKYIQSSFNVGNPYIYVVTQIMNYIIFKGRWGGGEETVS